MSFVAFNLPFAFDVGRLVGDLALVRPEDWTPHFNRAYYEGDWSAVPLRSVNGEARRIYPAPGPVDIFADTPLMSRFPYFQQVIAAFPMPLRTVRLLRLTAGSSIKEHTDNALGYEDGQVRFHIPIVTSPLVRFVVGGQGIDMRPGEAWYLNFNLPHSVRNDAAIDRIHLVIDGLVNDWVTSIFEEAAARFGTSVESTPVFDLTASTA